MNTPCDVMRSSDYYRYGDEYIFLNQVIEMTTNRRRFKKPSQTDFWIRTANNFT